MADAARKYATYADILALGDDVHAEILDGELIVHAAPLPVHGFGTVRLSTELDNPFQRGRGGPGGWWILAEVDVELSTGDTVRPDLAGWRHERMPLFPEGRPVGLNPDWVCEILSPSNADYDEGPKLDHYHAAAIPWVWHLDPQRRTLTVMQYDPRGYLRIVTGVDGTVRGFPPFEAVEIAVADLFPPRPVSAASASPRTDRPA